MAMELKAAFTIFLAIFIAELGDKTQLAVMLFATDNELSKLTIFVAASLALVLSSLLGIFVGSMLSAYIDQKFLAYFAGVLFILIGVYTLWQA